jgi:hypothetical protein
MAERAELLTLRADRVPAHSGRSGIDNAAAPHASRMLQQRGRLGGAAASRREYDRIEYDGIPVEVAVFIS